MLCRTTFAAYFYTEITVCDLLDFVTRWNTDSHSNPVLCSWDCPAYFVIQQVVVLLFCFLIIITVLIRRGCMTTYTLTLYCMGFIMCIGIWIHFAPQLHYYNNMIVLFISDIVELPHNTLFRLSCLFIVLLVCQKLFSKMLLHCFLFLFLSNVLILNLFFIWIKIVLCQVALYFYLLWFNSNHSLYTYSFCTYGLLLCSNFVLYHSIMHSGWVHYTYLVYGFLILLFIYLSITFFV